MVADRQRSDSAVRRAAQRQLQETDASRTARIFAARTLLDGTTLTLTDILVEYARDQSRHYFQPPERVRNDVREFCSASSEQGIDIDPESILSAVVPSDEQAVIERARAIRQSTLAPRDRRERLQSFLQAASEHGWSISRASLDSVPGSDAGEQDAEQIAADGEPSDDESEQSGRHPHVSVPTNPDELSNRLRTAAQNYVCVGTQTEECVM